LIKKKLFKAHSERKMNPMQCIVVCAALASLAGCSVAIRTEEAKISNNRVMGEGIAYYLPKTIVDLEQPVTLKRPGGALTEAWEKGEQVCRDLGVPDTEPIPIDPVKAQKARLEFGIPKLAPRVVADTEHLYKADITSGVFASVSTAIDLNPGGILGKSSSSVVNNTYEIATSLAKTAIGVALRAAVPVSATADVVAEAARNFIAAQNSRSPFKRNEVFQSFRGSNDLNLFTAAVEVEKKNKSELAAKCIGLRKLFSDSKLEIIATCGHWRGLRSCVESSAANLDEQIKVLSQFQREQIEKPSLDAEQLREYIAMINAEMARAEKKLSDDLKLYGVDEAPADLQFVLRAEIGDLLGSREAVLRGERISAVKPDLVLNSKTVGLLAISPVNSSGAPHLKAVYDLLADTNSDEFRYTLEPSIRSKLKNAVELPAQPVESGGFKYRVPLEVSIKTTMTKVSPKIKPLDFYAWSEVVPLAHFGPIASLNSVFKGKGGSVAFELWDQTGGLKKVAIGTEALPTSAVTGVIEKAEPRLLADRTTERLTAQAARLNAEAALAEAQRKLACIEAPGGSATACSK
jgi:hypothetical protein